MEQLYLFATLAGSRVAVAASEVEAVVKLTDISPVPGMPAHVAGLSALRSRVLTIIDAGALVRGRATPARRGSFAIIADLSGHSYGLVVDAVYDICHVPAGALPLRGQLDAHWAPYARGVVEHEGQPYLLVSLGDFIDTGVVAQAA